MENITCEDLKDIKCPNGRYLYIMRTAPYIDSLYIEFDSEHNPTETKQFTFREGSSWSSEDEEYFSERCVKDCGCAYSGELIETIFREYDAAHPEWHVRRYYANGLRLLDHIYSCMKQKGAKEILYKAGLDELAVHIDEAEELKLSAGKPSNIYNGLSMKILRSLNCPEGARLLEKKSLRTFIKDLNMKFPDVFGEKLNDAQCRYLLYLITGDLTVGETGRLFGARRQFLSGIWSANFCTQVLKEEIEKEKFREECKALSSLDPIYARYIKDIKDPQEDPMFCQLRQLLLVKRSEYDSAIRRSNRKRDQQWQERGDDYIVRYPQTINDFCREAVYMQNCLLTYIEGFIGSDTTILFMRRADDVNQPFITIEVYRGELMQAYHRFNTDCTKEESEWINAYCARHGILTGKFKFDAFVDELY